MAPRPPAAAFERAPAARPVAGSSIARERTREAPTEAAPELVPELAEAAPELKREPAEAPGAQLARRAPEVASPPPAPLAAGRDRMAAQAPQNGVQAERRGDEPSRVPASPPDDAGAFERGGATGPQLRRFIKSRAYVPMHELRRRFGINGNDDDVTAVDVDRHRVFVGLPDREGRLLGELLRGGDIGYELSMDPITPIVVGVYPMRPVTRP